MPRARRQLLASLTLSALLASAPLAARAQDERPPEHHYSEDWNGLFLGAGAHGGPGLIANTSIRDSLGWTAGATLSGALILTVASLQLDYLHGAYDATADGDPFFIATDSLALSLNFHPGFLLTLYGAGVGYIVASFYVQFGVSAEFTSIDWRERALDERWDVGVHWGGGFDVPLTNADRGSSLWLGFNYRWNDVPVDLRVLDGLVLADEEDLRQHLFLLRLSYRHKGLPF